MKPELRAIFNGEPADEPRRPRGVILRELRELVLRHSQGDELESQLAMLEEVESRPIQRELFR